MEQFLQLMGTIFLQFLGAVFLLLFFGLLAVFLLIRRQWKKDQGTCPTCAIKSRKIHLNEDLDAAWVREDPVRAVVRELEVMGFSPGTAYFAKEHNDLKIYSLFMLGRRITALVYMQDPVDIWTEMMVQFEDDSELWVGNSPVDKVMAVLSETQRVYLRQAGPRDLYREIERNLGERQPVMINDGNFRDVFEKKYEGMIKRLNTSQRSIKEDDGNRKAGEDEFRDHLADVMEEIK